MAIAAFSAGGAAASFLGPAFASGTVRASVLGAAEGLGGNLLVNALESKANVGDERFDPVDRVHLMTDAAIWAAWRPQ